MSRPDPTYPSKRVQTADGNFTFRQFFLPVRINEEEVWALLDTGANISIMPKEIANEVIFPHQSPKNRGLYQLAGLIEVPYETYQVNFEILDYIEDTIPALDLEPYIGETHLEKLHQVEFQVPKLTWPEIADKLQSEDPLSIRGDQMSYIILGLYGVLDQLTISFVGNNSVSISPYGPG